MAVIKCKSCGGNLILDTEQNIGTCEYCGIVQTITKHADDEHKITLFNRGNDLRRRFEFDRAIALFEKIVEMDETDAEAHWCLALSRHGIEYVDSPSDGRKVPTCHRLNAETILNDYDYQQALEHASLYTKHLYQEQAQEIAEIQKRIFAISQKETPFDVFICFKDTDDTTGQRTQDSVDAQDIYYQLTDLGYKVFFSRVTLETKGGEEYEPYIFSALHSAKVMIVVGSKKEYYEAVWVRNEWSRYLNIIREEKQHSGYSSRLLIPCYRNIDAYDLPDELNLFQAYNMSKIGFVQDLVHGIRKVVGSPTQTPKEEHPTVPEKRDLPDVAPAPITSTAALLERAQMFLDSSAYEKAIEYSERVLDLEPRNGSANMIRLLAEYKKSKPADLRQVGSCIQSNMYFINVLQYGNAKQKEVLNQCIEEIAYDEKLNKYQSLQQRLAVAGTSVDFFNLADGFLSLGDFKDAQELGTKLRQKGQEKKTIEQEKQKQADLENRYLIAIKDFDTAKMQQSLELCQKAIQEFASIGDYKDSKSKKAIAEIEADSLEKKENTYVKIVETQNKLVNKSPSEGTTHAYFELYEDLLNLGAYKDCSSRMNKVEPLITEYLVERQRALASNYASLASQKNASSSSLNQYKREIDEIAKYRISHGRLELECGKYEHRKSVELANKTQHKTTNAAFDDLIPKIFLGIAVIFVAIILYAIC